MSEQNKEYVLGTGQDELNRLGIQHRIWADATTAVWKKAGIGPGAKVLDLGCGPGFATLDLAQLVTDSGVVVAVDESENFLQYLKKIAVAQGLPQIQTAIADAQDLRTTISTQFDFVYCRWVLCWLKDPTKALQEIYKVLKPGGKLILHDYFNWQVMTTGPRSAAIDKMVRAAISSFEDRHGNVDLCGDMLPMLKQTRFHVTHFDVHQRVARGGGVDSTVHWAISWWRTYGPKLVQLNKLSAEDCEAALRDISLIETDPNRFFYCPPVFEFIAEKSNPF